MGTTEQQGVRQRYWVTVHWPPERGTKRDAGVFLADGTEHVGNDLAPGDLVWIFESRSGRKLQRRLPDGTATRVLYEEGRRGMVGLSQITGRVFELDVKPDLYDDGTKKWWRWYAPGTEVRSSGFISHEEVNRLLGYKPDYPMRGFARRTGLREIDLATHVALMRAFDEHIAPLPSTGLPPVERGLGGGEGPEHRALKERIARDPAGILGEAGLIHVATEFSFQTGDRADLILADGLGRFIGLEVEVQVDMKDLSGVLQAIKYRAMYALIARRPYGEGRAFLVAHAISNEVRDLCGAHGIECFEVSRSAKSSSGPSAA